MYRIHTDGNLSLRGAKRRGNLPDKDLYGQRWQVETVMSMIKRNFGSALHAIGYCSQSREMLLLALPHNIAIILLLKELFYRAYRTPSVPGVIATTDCLPVLRKPGNR